MKMAEPPVTHTHHDLVERIKRTLQSVEGAPCYHVVVWQFQGQDGTGLPARGWGASPDSIANSSRAEAADVGAAKREGAPLGPSDGANWPEMREQPRRESCPVGASGGSEERGQVTDKSGDDATSLTPWVGLG